MFRSLRRFVGFFLLADRRLETRMAELELYKSCLERYLGKTLEGRLIPQFIERAVDNYSRGRKSALYKFASREAQLDYDKAWHRVGRLIKELQAKSILPRESIPLYNVERVILENERRYKDRNKI